MASSSHKAKIQQLDPVRVEIRDWVVSSDNSSFVLGPLEFDLEKGEILGIIGKSGAGKSIFIKSLFGILPDGFSFEEKTTLSLVNETGEKITWFPINMTEHDWVQWRKYFLGYLPQDPAPSFDPIKKIGKQIALIYRSKLLDFDLSEFYQEFAQIGIDPSSGFLKKYPHQLSGGQAQRMAFVMSKLGAPRVIVADEPTASLDSDLIAATASMIKNWKVHNNGSAIVSSHDWRFISKIADKVIILDNGKICEKGISSNVLSEPRSNIGSELKHSMLVPHQKRDDSEHTVRSGTEVVLHQVSKTYQQKKSAEPALIDTTMTLKSSKLGIYGRSGSGKSTLAKIVGGIIPPSTGEVLINGHKINFRDTDRFHHLSNLVQYIAQDPFSAFSPRRTVGASIMEVIDAHHPEKTLNEREEMLIALMEKCHLDKALSNRYPKSLSGGEKQRFAIIRAVACRPELLILDEVTAALDNVSRKRILDMISDLVSTNKISYWIISHDQDVIDYMSDETLLIHEGKISIGKKSTKSSH